MDKLNVKVDGSICADLLHENSEYVLSYVSENRDKFISLTMPVRQKDYVHNRLHPIFEMHLPEGYLLSIIKKHFSKLTKMDDYGLLKVMSASINGRITYEQTKQINKQNITLDDLLYPKKDNLFEELVSKFALTSALSGVQPKVLASIEDKATLKVDDFIVKSWGDDYKELALNEYYCMKAVKEAGIKVPEFFISSDEKLFIMKRFDKNDDGTYLGFEDMCVLMAKQRDDKYEGSCEQITKTIKIFVSPHNKKKALESFFKMMVVNYLVKNGDAHLKNFGLIYNGIDDIDLAPAYDVVSTTVYIKNDIPALLLLGSKKWWDEKYLLNFGIQACELTQKDAKKLYDLCKRAISKIAKEIENRLLTEINEDKKEVLEKLYIEFSKS